MRITAMVSISLVALAHVACANQPADTRGGKARVLNARPVGDVEGCGDVQRSTCVSEAKLQWCDIDADGKQVLMEGECDVDSLEYCDYETNACTPYSNAPNCPPDMPAEGRCTEEDGIKVARWCEQGRSFSQLCIYGEPCGLDQAAGRMGCLGCGSLTAEGSCDDNGCWEGCSDGRPKIDCYLDHPSDMCCANEQGGYSPCSQAEPQYPEGCDGVDEIGFCNDSGCWVRCGEDQDGSWHLFEDCEALCSYEEI